MKQYRNNINFRNRINSSIEKFEKQIEELNTINKQLTIEKEKQSKELITLKEEISKFTTMLDVCEKEIETLETSLKEKTCECAEKLNTSNGEFEKEKEKLQQEIIAWAEKMARSIRF